MRSLNASTKNRVMRLTRKYRLIQLAGGKCIICGYNRNISSLAFHHVHEKGRRLNGHNLSSMNIQQAEEELDRCVLVCHNCHGEIHNPVLTMENMNHLHDLVERKVLTLNEAFKKFFLKGKKKV